MRGETAVRLLGRGAAAGLVLGISVSVGSLVAAPPADAGERLYVQVAETRLRRDAGFLSPSIAVLAFGEALEKLAEGGAWLRVSRDPKTEGWVHGSALTNTRLILKPGEQDVSVGTGRAEPTLAGKGFSAETETDFKAKNPAVDFGILDTLEASGPTDEEVLQFAREGGLR